MQSDIIRENIINFLNLNINNEVVNYEICDEWEKDGYNQKLISYKGKEEDEIFAYLLIPKGNGNFPAVIIHHQHNGERHLGKSEVCGLIGNQLQSFGISLVKCGFIVLAPDSICFEDRRSNSKGTLADEENDWLQHYNEMSYRIVKGDTLMRKVLDDASIGVSLLFHHPLVDNNRIGTMGHSYGGNTAIFLASLDTRIQFMCSSGAACTYKNKIENKTGLEMALIIPGFNKYYDIIDLIKCIAPRKVLLVSGTTDKYSKDAKEIELHLKEELQDYNFSWLEHKRFDGGHSITKERFNYIINWFKALI